MLHVPNLLLISGNGRDSGKTSFACELIRFFSKELEITAIKISPHFHEPEGFGEVIYADDATILTRERNTLSGKDSSRMLHSGAKEVLYIQARNELLHTAIKKLTPIWESGKPVICESGGLINHLRPGLFFMLRRTDIAEPKTANHHDNLVDKWINFNKQSFDINIDEIGFSNNCWHLNI